MLTKHLHTIINRDLKQLQTEISLYENEDSLWKVVPGTLNSGGNLALHITGNLRHFIGHILGKSDYVRNREYEFSATAIEKSQLVELINLCRDEVSKTLNKLTAEDLTKDFPVEIKDVERQTQFVLLHLSAHLNYHLGQINYHRRIISVLDTEL